MWRFEAFFNTAAMQSEDGFMRRKKKTREPASFMIDRFRSLCFVEWMSTRVSISEQVARVRLNPITGAGSEALILYNLLAKANEERKNGRFCFSSCMNFILSLSSEFSQIKQNRTEALSIQPYGSKFRQHSYPDSFLTGFSRRKELRGSTVRSGGIPVSDFFSPFQT